MWECPRAWSLGIFFFLLMLISLVIFPRFEILNNMSLLLILYHLSRAFHEFYTYIYNSLLDIFTWVSSRHMKPDMAKPSSAILAAIFQIGSCCRFLILSYFLPVAQAKTLVSHLTLLLLFFFPAPHYTYFSFANPVSMKIYPYSSHFSLAHSSHPSPRPIISVLDYCSSTLTMSLLLPLSPFVVCFGYGSQSGSVKAYMNHALFCQNPNSFPSHTE